MRINVEATNLSIATFWVGLDGYDLNDLVQAGSEEECLPGGLWVEYATFTRVVPNESMQFTGIDPDPGDELIVDVWISTGSGLPDPNGSYAGFVIAGMRERVLHL